MPQTRWLGVCTEDSRAYVGDTPVIDSSGSELEEIVGTEVYVELRHRITGRLTRRAEVPSEEGQ